MLKGSQLSASVVEQVTADADRAEAAAAQATASQASAILSASAAGIASGRLVCASFAELATLFGYSGSGRARIVAAGDIVQVLGLGYYVAMLSSATGVDYDYTGTGGVKFNDVLAQVTFDRMTLSSGKLPGYVTFMGPNGARVYAEPDDDIDDDIATAFKAFADPYSLRVAKKYRDAGFYYHKTKGSWPGVGMALINSKVGSARWGVAGEAGFSIQDASAIPIRAGWVNHLAQSAYFDIVYWDPGKPITAGQYALVGGNADEEPVGNVYLATTTGTTGNNEPFHTSGSASDGGVTWQFVESLAATSSGYRGYAIIGDQADKPIVSDLIRTEEVVAQFSRSAAVHVGKSIDFMGAANAVLAASITGMSNSDLEIVLRTLTKSAYIRAANGTTSFRFTDNLFSILGGALQLDINTQSGNETLLNCVDTNVVVLSNTAPTLISTVSGRAGQPVLILPTNGNSTLVNTSGATGIVTNTEGNVALSQWQLKLGLFYTANRLMMLA